MDASNPVNHNTFNLNNCSDTDDDFHIFERFGGKCA